MKASFRFWSVAVCYALLSLFSQAGLAQTGFNGLKVGGTLGNFSSPTLESTYLPGFVTGGFAHTAISYRLDWFNEYSIITRGAVVPGRESIGFNRFDTAQVDQRMRFVGLEYCPVINIHIKSPYLFVQVGGFFAFQRLIGDVGDFYWGEGDDMSDLIYLPDFKLGTTRDGGFLFGISGGTEEIRVNLRYRHGFLNPSLPPKEEALRVNSRLLEVSCSLFL
ncbi:MAG: hypothetical protein AAFP02_07535 [Bacteroidota bacterium]